MKTIHLLKGKEKAMMRRHPWVFSGALANHSGIEEGDWVELRNAKDEFVAIAHYQSPKASIRLKLVSFDQEIIDEAWWISKLQGALNSRVQMGFPSKTTNAFRWIYGEGDSLPGLIIDVYGTHVVIQCHTLGMHREMPQISKAIQSILGKQVETIYDKSGESLHHDEIESQFILGNTSHCEVLENGVRFNVNWVEGQKTGFFLDQRDNRAAVEQYSQGAKVLNAFAYSGGFSMYALRGGAETVISVDLSSSACALADANAKINGFETKHQSVTSDVIEYLKTMDDDFDIVILDPPAFAKRKKAVHNAIQAYKRINAMAMKRMPQGSLLYTFSCSQNITAQIFKDTIRAAAIEVGRPIQIIGEMRQPADHPENVFFPEGHYLKGLLLKLG